MPSSLAAHTIIASNGKFDLLALARNVKNRPAGSRAQSVRVARNSISRKPPAALCPMRLPGKMQPPLNTLLRPAASSAGMARRGWLLDCGNRVMHQARRRPRCRTSPRCRTWSTEMNLDTRSKSAVGGSRVPSVCGFSPAPWRRTADGGSDSLIAPDSYRLSSIAIE